MANINVNSFPNLFSKYENNSFILGAKKLNMAPDANSVIAAAAANIFSSPSTVLMAASYSLVAMYLALPSIW